MTRRSLIVGSALVGVALAVPGGRLAAEGSTGGAVLRVIVHPQNPVKAVERKFLADVFLKKVTRWGHLETIRPVDQKPDAPVRASFTVAVMRRSVEAVKTYWQQAIFSGRDIPPPELDSDEDVVRYVLRTPGAVGYVSGTADLRGARALAVR